MKIKIPVIFISVLTLLSISAFSGCDTVKNAEKTVNNAVSNINSTIENNPVTSRKPNSTISLLVPKGRNNTLANWASSPVFVAAIASTKPPINSMITGSAKHAMTPL